MSLEVGGGQTIRTLQAEAAFGAALAVIKGTGANQVKLPAAANVAALGISGLAGDPADAKKLNVPVITQGEAEATAGGVIAVGDRVRIEDSTGRLVVVGGEAVGAVVETVGRAMSAAAADGDPFALMVDPDQLFDQLIAEAQIGGAAPATAANWGAFFIADRAYEVIEAVERHEVVGGTGAACMVEKVPSGTAPGAGTAVLAAAFDLEATANTNVTGALHATQANRQLAAGDALAIDEAGTLTGLVGLSVRVTLRRL